MENFFTHSEANWFGKHGLFRVTAFSIYNRKREVEPGILIQMGRGCNGLKNFSKGLRDVKESGISARKRQSKCGDCAWRKSTLHVRLNGGVTLTVGRALLLFFVYKNEKKKKKRKTGLQISRSRSFPQHIPVICYVLFHDPWFPGRFIFLESKARLLCKCNRRLKVACLSKFMYNYVVIVVAG